MIRSKTCRKLTGKKRFWITFPVNFRIMELYA